MRVLSEAAFARVIRAGDSQRFGIDLKNNRAAILQDAVSQASSKPASLPQFSTATVRGKMCVSYPDFSTHLILRSISRHLQRRLRISLPSRDRIVRGVIESLLDRTPMYLMRRDITSFYESVPLASLRAGLLFDTASSAQVRSFLRAYFDQHCLNKECGLPRGIGLSALLAEIAMRRFDQRVREIPGVYKYYRFSDDILILSFLPFSEVSLHLGAALPDGMQFNPKKSYDLALAAPKGQANDESFEFLGYKFTVEAECGLQQSRRVRVGISQRKIDRLKTRVILSMKDFAKNRDYVLLKDRVAFITSNYQVRRSGASHVAGATHVKSGIYYNYRLCGVYYSQHGRTCYDPSPARELKDLDGFLRSLVRGGGSAFAPLLTAGRRAELARYSFFKGYEKRMVVRFGSSRVHAVKSAWAVHA